MSITLGSKTKSKLRWHYLKLTKTREEGVHGSSFPGKSGQGQGQCDLLGSQCDIPLEVCPFRPWPLPVLPSASEMLHNNLESKGSLCHLARTKGEVTLSTNSSLCLSLVRSQLWGEHEGPVSIPTWATSTSPHTTQGQRGRAVRRRKNRTVPAKGRALAAARPSAGALLDPLCPAQFSLICHNGNTDENIQIIFPHPSSWRFLCETPMRDVKPNQERAAWDLVRRSF